MAKTFAEMRRSGLQSKESSKIVHSVQDPSPSAPPPDSRAKSACVPAHKKHQTTKSVYKLEKPYSTTTVVNVRKRNLNKIGYKDLAEWVKKPNNVYIGRNMTYYVPGAVGSKWRNPFKGKEREECCRRYKEYIKTDKKIQANGKTLLQSLGELKGKNIGCWCHPEKCHGHMLAELIEEYGV